jgi:hypothetical protein
MEVVVGAEAIQPRSCQKIISRRALKLRVTTALSIYSLVLQFRRLRL